MNMTSQVETIFTTKEKKKERKLSKPLYLVGKLRGDQPFYGQLEQNIRGGKI